MICKNKLFGIKQGISYMFANENENNSFSVITKQDIFFCLWNRILRSKQLILRHLKILTIDGRIGYISVWENNLKEI